MSPIFVCGPSMDEWLGPPPYERLTRRERDALELIADRCRETGGASGIPRSGIPAPIRCSLDRRYSGGYLLGCNAANELTITTRGLQVLEIEQALDDARPLVDPLGEPYTTPAIHWDAEHRCWMPGAER